MCEPATPTRCVAWCSALPAWVSRALGWCIWTTATAAKCLEDATRSLAEQSLKPSVQAALATDGANLSQVLAQVAEARTAAVLLATAGTVSVELVRGLKKNAPGVFAGSA